MQINNRDGEEHSFTAAGIGNTGLISAGGSDSISFTAQTRGTFNVRCTEHAGMSAQIIVS